MKHYDVVFLNCLIVLLHICHLVNTELFTAIVDFEPLLHTEGEAARALDDYIELEEERLQDLRRIKDEFQNMYDKAMQDPSLFLANPVNAFLVVKHLTADWYSAKKIMDDKRSKEVIDELMNNDKFYFPGDEDLVGAAEALFRLQDTYLLNTTELANGHIKGATMSSKMTASDCFELGYAAYDKRDYYHAGLWLTEAVNLVRKENPRSIEKSIILEYLAHVYFLIKDTRKAVKLTRRVLVEEPTHPLVHKNLEYFSSFLTHAEKRQLEKPDPKYDAISLGRIHAMRPPLNPYFGDYEKLCRGEKVKTPQEEKRLYCRYTTNNSSYLLLQPAKEEVLSLDPKIVVYHGIISDSDAELFKDLAFPELATATVSNRETASLETATYRVSKSAWFEDADHPRIARNTRMIEALMGLSGSTAEPMHIINYGIGGHYEPHFDFRREFEADGFAKFNIGNRIATWIYYLSNVDAGGSTVFPDIGVEIKAEKGAAGMWYNLYRNGTGDLGTKHAACPVLAGTKWVANKWFHEFDNEFKRPCALDRKL